MTYSENKFREYLKKVFMNEHTTFIKKIPDKKQIGSSANKGLPDYIVISEGKTYWFEVKQVRHKYDVHTFNLNHISDTQWITFTAMTNAGAQIYIAIYLNKELYIIAYKDLQFAKFISGETSIHETVLGKWRQKWNPKNLSP